jgi:hypothetical protein
LISNSNSRNMCITKLPAADLQHKRGKNKGKAKTTQQTSAITAKEIVFYI